MSNRNGKAKKKKHPIKEHFSISFINDNIIITHRFKKCKCFKILSFGILRKKGRLVFKITSTIKEKI